MDDIELIKLIENYPILYDKDIARSARNAANKDAAWKTISQKVGASERACITRWKSIRDRFGKEFRRFQENPESPTYWDMFPRLLFLKDHYKHGQVKHESLDHMKFEPRHRKPRRPRLEDIDKKQSEEKLELDPLDIELCQQLIELVKLHPVLYDRHKIRNSKNLSAKNDAWRAISESLNVSGELERRMIFIFLYLKDILILQRNCATIAGRSYAIVLRANIAIIRSINPHPLNGDISMIFCFLDDISAREFH